jgi:hypothetical protein
LPETFEIKGKLAVMPNCQQVHRNPALCGTAVTIYAIKNQIIIKKVLEQYREP